jgi:hypothetical protein
MNATYPLISLRAAHCCEHAVTASCRSLEVVGNVRVSDRVLRRGGEESARRGLGRW